MSVDDGQRIFPPECYTKRGRLRREVYLSELERLQIELVKLQEWVKARLRSSRVPAKILFKDQLPYNEMGKVLRRLVKKDFA